MSRHGNDIVVHLVDLCLPGKEVEEEDSHFMRMTGVDPYLHLRGPQGTIHDPYLHPLGLPWIIREEHGLPLGVTLEEGLHPHLENLIDLVVLSLHLAIWISLMTEEDHLHGTGIGETGEDLLVKRD